MVFGRPLRHIIAAFSDGPQRGIGAKAGYLREIYPCEHVERFTYREVGFGVLREERQEPLSYVSRDTAFSISLSHSMMCS